uniref:ORF54 n=1 Tax=Nitrosopumilaceae spindle-shaped virus TaxID=3065433 RepID=A0AAT9J974_9VIRU
MTLDRERFEKTGASVGTWFYQLDVTETEMNDILRNQKIVSKLNTLVDSMDVEGSIPNHWVKEVLSNLLKDGSVNLSK